MPSISCSITIITGGAAYLYCHHGSLLLLCGAIAEVADRASCCKHAALHCIVCFLDIAQSACLCLSLLYCTQCKPCIHGCKQSKARPYRWPDFGIPNSPTPLRRLAHLLDESDNPQAGSPVVHCSAGIGRTGTFVAIDVVMKRLRHLDGKDIKGELPGSADCLHLC